MWQDIVKNYDTYRCWYENKNYYHKIGFLIHEKDGSKTLPDLMAYANSGKYKKSAFDKHLLEQIRKVIQNNEDEPLSTLSYDNRSNYNKLKNILLLYNVELTNQSPAIESRFPFKDYKAQEGVDDNGKAKRGWTLEHIHAQNSECLNPVDRKEWINWAHYTLEARENAVDKSEADLQFISKLKHLLQKNVDTGKSIMEDEKSFTYRDNLVPLFQEDLDLWSGGKPYIVEHLLSNLALLSGEVNSSIGKSAFYVKQQCINMCIAKGQYVPIATQKVFMKHYYSNDSNKDELLSRQLITWDESDRNNYIESIKDVLVEYKFNF